jgi:hypothetical protein
VRFPREDETMIDQALDMYMAGSRIVVLGRAARNAAR